MANEIVVPRLGWNMEQGTFLGWLKRDGESVRAGEPLYRLEGDKAEQEIEATDSGVLRVAPDGPAEGDVVAVGTVLGHLVGSGAGEPAPAAERGGHALPPLSPEYGGEGSGVRGGASNTPRPLTPNPSPPVSGGEGDRKAASPRARRAARERGIDPSTVSGTGRNGRVRERDVLAYAVRAEPSSTPARVQRILPTRRAIADRLLHSLRTTAPVTLTTTADAANLVSLRGQFRAVATDAVPSFTDFLVKLTALALRQHPTLASRWEEDRIVPPTEIHIGLAVDTEAGLLVPVIRDVPALSIRQIARQTRELAEKARQRRLTSRDMEGGSFTITNLGMFGIDAFTPIIHWPQCAILGVGRIDRQPAVVSGQVVPRDRLTLSLTFDHRVVDGAPAARFLQTLCQGIENPSAWLVD